MRHKIEEIYDILMQQLLKAAHKYDPLYSEKMAKVVAILDRKARKRTAFQMGRSRDIFALPGPRSENQKDFSIDELNQHLEFDGIRFVRVLCRHGFLEAAAEQADGVRRYRRRTSWPPPAEYLSAGQIGFAYYLQMWFRYYLQIYIEAARSKLEAREGVYSLDFHRNLEDGQDDEQRANPLAAVVGREAKWWLNQETDTGSEHDLGQMNLEWVLHTADPLFCDLSRQDRQLLYLFYVPGGVNYAKRRHLATMNDLASVI